MNEPNEVWLLRKVRHINQMNMQNQLLASCVAEIWETGKPCLHFCPIAVSGKKECEPAVFWQLHYQPSFSCLFQQRIGLQGEGGKWVCDPKNILKDNPKKDKTNESSCLVYSIGSHGSFDFERGVHDQIWSGCEIHTIDRSPWRHYKKGPPPEYVHYHTYTIGPSPHTDVSTLVQRLGHVNRTIDILKIDCEGCEWETYKSWFGEGVYIRQIQVELHGIGKNKGIDAVHDFFKTLFDMGYVVFNKEPNTSGCQGCCVEYAFVKMSPSFSRATEATAKA